MLLDSLGQRLAGFLVNQLGVAQALDAIARLKNHRPGHHRAKQAAATNFVHAGNKARAGFPRQLFKFLCALQPLEQPHLHGALGKRQSRGRIHRDHALLALDAGGLGSGGHLFPDASIGAFFPEIVPLKLFGRNFSMRQKHGLAIDESCQPQRQMSHAETVLIVNGSQGECRRINRSWTLRKMLLVDPYVNDFRLQLQNLGDAEIVAVDDGVVRSLKEL